MIWKSCQSLIRLTCQLQIQNGCTEVEDVIGLDASEAVLASARAGIGIEEILEQIVEKVPAPTGDVEAPLQALIFDSVYDAYRGVILQVRVVNGMVKPGDKIQPHEQW